LTLAVLSLGLTIISVVLTVRALASRFDSGAKFAVVLSAATTFPCIATWIQGALAPRSELVHTASLTWLMVWVLVGPVLLVASALVLPFKRDGESFLATRIVQILAWVLSTYTIFTLVD
jgi:hypothetical protein